MAVHNDSRLYSGGAVTLDSRPEVNLYAQIQQKREAQRLAKEDAFKDYINNLNTKITPAGVRVNDLPAFDEMKNKWMEYGLKNKSALQKNDIPTQTEFNRQYQQLVNLIMRSKAEEEKKKPYVEILVDPAKRSKTSSRLINDIHIHDEPLFIKNANGEWEENRTRKGLDIAENYFNPQFDFDKEFTGWSKGMERGKTYSEKPIKSDPQSGTVTFSTEEKFVPEQIRGIADNALKSVKSEGESRNFYQHKLENIADEYLNKFNKVFQSVFGETASYTDPSGKLINLPNLIDTPEELAAAEAILQAQSMNKKGEELRLDKQLANQRAQVNISLNKGGSLGTDLLDYDILGTYKNKEVNIEATKNGVKENFKGVVVKDVDSKDQELIGVKPYTDNGLTYYKVRPDGDWEGRGGQVISWAKVAQANLDKTSANEAKRGRTTLTADKTKGSNIPVTKPTGGYEKTQSGTYNGKKVTIGLKNGKWYDTTTGKEIK